MAHKLRIGRKRAGSVPAVKVFATDDLLPLDAYRGSRERVELWGKMCG